MARAFAAGDFVAFNGVVFNQGSSVSLRMRTTQVPPAQGVSLIGKMDAMDRGGFHLIFQNNPATATLYIRTATGVFTLAIGSSGYALNDGAWHHIAANFDFRGGRPAEIWADGVLVATGTNSSLSGGLSQPIRLGQQQSSDRAGYVGELAEVYVWDQEGVFLTPGEITGLARGVPGHRVRPTPSLLIAAPLIRDVQNLRGTLPSLPTVSGTTAAPHPRRYG